MLVLEVLLSLKSKKGDYMAAIVHAGKEEGKNIYMGEPNAFIWKAKFLSLKSAFGLWQSPRAFMLYLTKKWPLQCRASMLDPCNLIGKKFMSICDIANMIFCTLDESVIDELANQLISVGLLLDQEINTAEFLGVGMETDSTELKWMLFVCTLD